MADTSTCKWAFSLFGNKDQSDVELQIEATQDRHTFVFPAHSLVLRNVSSVFHTMLDPEKFKEGIKRVAEIKLHGTKAQAIAFIRYLYTEELQTRDENMYAALMQNAHFFDMKELYKLCERKIRTLLTPFSVCNTYSTLHKIMSKDLVDLCESLMLRFAFIIFCENLHVVLTEETMIFLLSSEKLNVLDEEQVLQATWSWGHGRYNLEEDIGARKPNDIITKLLPLIKWDDIGDLESKYPWFNLYLQYKSLITNSSPTVERNIEKVTSLSCFANVIDFYDHLKSLNSILDNAISINKQALITFTSDHTIMLTGIEIYTTLYQAVQGDLPFFIFVNALKLENISYRSVQQQKFYKDSIWHYYYLFAFYFSKPVVLKKGKIHVIYCQKSLLDVAAQKLEMVSDALDSGLLGSDGDVRFFVTEPVIGVRKVFYFFKS